MRRRWTLILMRAWPRTMAVAECGWSSKETRDPETLSPLRAFTSGVASFSPGGLALREPLDPGTHCPRDFVPAYTRPW